MNNLTLPLKRLDGGGVVRLTLGFQLEFSADQNNRIIDMAGIMIEAGLMIGLVRGRGAFSLDLQRKKDSILTRLEYINTRRQCNIAEVQLCRIITVVQQCRIPSFFGS